MIHLKQIKSVFGKTRPDTQTNLVFLDLRVTETDHLFDMPFKRRVACIQD